MKVRCEGKQQSNKAGNRAPTRVSDGAHTQKGYGTGSRRQYFLMKALGEDAQQRCNAQEQSHGTEQDCSIADVWQAENEYGKEAQGHGDGSETVGATLWLRQRRRDQ